MSVSHVIRRARWGEVVMGWWNRARRRFRLERAKPSGQLRHSGTQQRIVQNNPLLPMSVVIDSIENHDTELT